MHIGIKNIGDLRKWLEKFSDDKPVFWMQREVGEWLINPYIGEDNNGDILFEISVFRKENKTVCLNHPDYTYPW